MEKEKQTPVNVREEFKSSLKEKGTYSHPQQVTRTECCYQVGAVLSLHQDELIEPL